MNIEPLEARIAPAGLVDVDYTPATGVLILTGDGMDNLASVFQTGPNTWRVEGRTTSIDVLGIDFLDIGKLTSLTIDGAGGSDTFTLTNLRTLTALSFSGGAGDDHLDVENLTVKGAVELHGNTGDDQVIALGLSTIIGGNLTADSDAAATDSIGISLDAQRTTIGGSVFFTGGGGFDYLESSLVAPSSIAKGVNFNAGAGGGELTLASSDRLSIGKLASGESILYTGGDGIDSHKLFGRGTFILAGGIRMTGGAMNDEIRFLNATGKVTIGKLATGQSILFDGGPDDDSINTAATSLTLAGALDFIGGDGANTITLDGENGIAKIGKLATGQSIRSTGGTGADRVISHVAGLTLAGGIDFAPGDGSNDIRLSSPNGMVKMGKLATGQSILYTGGSGFDEINTGVALATLAGGVEMNAADGGNSLKFDSDSADGVVKIGKFGTGRSVLFTGTGNAANDFRLGGTVTLAGSAEATGGTGPDNIQARGKISIGKSAAGVSVLLDGGDGDDQIEFDGNFTLAGSLQLEGGNHADEMDLGGIGTMNVKGAVGMNGGAGEDLFTLVGLSVILGSTLTVTGGDDADDFTLDADGSIAGNVSVDLGLAAAGVQSAVLTGNTSLPSRLTLKGSLTVDAAGVATADALTMRNVFVAKLIDLDLGDGVSSVTIDNLTAGDELRLETGDDADVVNIERGNFFGGSVIKKLATILLGDGDDQLAIGNPVPTVVLPFPDHTRVSFLGGLTADGGGHVAGDDRNDFALENTFPPGVLPTLLDFEAMTIV